MGLIWVLEVVSIVLGLILFWIEVFKLRCKNFIPAMFLLLYVPLFCVSPLLYHFLVGGAYTIDKKVEGTIFTDQAIYAIYHLYNISMLICFFVASEYFNKRQEPKQILSPPSTSQQRLIFFIHLLTGVYLYVSSTGLSLFELLVADRFTWFVDPNYSSFYSVVASYFISLAPLFFFIRSYRGKILSEWEQTCI
jgi:hypothetical protein